MTITIHVIFHAHLDPVWMWPWTSGLDEVLATSRSACDRLDAHPDLCYTQGEAWSFAMIERADPGLFARIARHIAGGRWEVAGGWWTQPDCNFPTVDGLRRQISTGLAYCRDRFGVAPRCGFNPDSFGHCAILPDLLREAGQDRYVFMRPQEHELRLPARLFRWRSRAGAEPVTAFRIPLSYANGTTGAVWHEAVNAAVQALPPGCTHTMTFMGVGNHGGGPTEALIRWVREHRDLVPGARLEFSTLERAFDAIEREAVALPEVVGELQMHAIGCYTVERGTKTGVHRAEHLLARAECVIPEAERPRLEQAWRSVAAHQFHDTLGGTSTAEAYRFVADDLGGAAATGEEILAYALRRQIAELPDDPLPRLILANPGRDPIAGWHEAEVYVEGIWMRPWRLVDGEGSEVPFQLLESDAGTDPRWHWGKRRVLVAAAIPAGGLGVLRQDPRPPQAVAAQVSAGPDRIANTAGVSVALSPWGARLEHAGRSIPIAFHLIADTSDTWSHGLDRFADGPGAEAVWEPPRLADRGPLMASLIQRGTLGDNRLIAEWRVYAGGTYVDLHLTVDWRACQQVLKLVLPGDGATERVDGTPGLALTRANDGQERPLADWTLGGGLGVVCPEAWAIDATPQRTRLTLLRSPFLAHHGPAPIPARAPVADQGVHRFRFRFHLGACPPERLAAEALAWNRPALTAECTRGMPTRAVECRA